VPLDDRAGGRRADDERKLESVFRGRRRRRCSRRRGSHGWDPPIRCATVALTDLSDGSVRSSGGSLGGLPPPERRTMGRASSRGYGWFHRNQPGYVSSISIAAVDISNASRMNSHEWKSPHPSASWRFAPSDRPAP